ncbi:hydrolase [Bifidobacterium dolichotidis]|uniref:Hydrolase n=1 Tax=Bifidobacterium dolichotidis TaxID=2306976 RepID=A0A430FSF5_9BIFI|nr:Cof-type HAD-IIB family hydrolase [Bifidobacterium dolichotidis]RSX55793.1 hydrolase [Bifidobacterium dolichotidis]
MPYDLKSAEFNEALLKRAENIYAAFFDIDGTLTSFTTNSVPESTIEALHELQQRGICIFICTGRAPSFLSVVLDRIPITFDGIVGLNGQYCVVDNEIIRSKPLEPRDVRTIIDWLNEHPEIVASFCEEDYVYFNHANEQMKAQWKSLGKTAPKVFFDDPMKRTLDHDTFQISPYISYEQECDIVSRCDNVRGVRWAPSFSDLITGDGGKHRGIETVMEHFGWTCEQAIAFGDSGNDIDMLQAAGIGVAMGNAAADVQQEADIVTDDVDHDGIMHALTTLRIL